MIGIYVLNACMLDFLVNATDLVILSENVSTDGNTSINGSNMFKVHIPLDYAGE